MPAVYIYFVRGLFVLGLCLSGSSASAEVYKWTDANGQMHFGDRPPSSGAETVPVPESADAPAAVTPQERLEKQRKLLNAFEEERRQKRDAAEQARKDREERIRKCNNLRDDLRNQENAGRVYRLDKNGNRVFMNAEERAASTAELRKQVAYWCGKP